MNVPPPQRFTFGKAGWFSLAAFGLMAVAFWSAKFHWRTDRTEALLVPVKRSAVEMPPLANPATAKIQPALAATPSESLIHTLNGEAARTELRKSGGYESLGAAFQAARYAAEKIDPAGPHSRGAEYFAANPKQQLRAWFSKDGIELTSSRDRPSTGDKRSPALRSSASARLAAENWDADNAVTSDSDGPSPLADQQPWNLSLRLRAGGRSGAMVELTPTDVRAEGNLVETIDSGAGFTQWFENGKEGIEQGFTMAQRPAGAGPVEIVLSVEGTLHPQLSSTADGTAPGIHFVTPDGAEVLHYSSLKAWDATGRKLEGRMEMRGSGVALLIADSGAQYPITIDPLFVNVEKRLTEDSAAFDMLGFAVSLSGDTALVGAPSDETAGGLYAGSAYVFVRNGTTWRQQAKLIAADGAAFDNFGHAVSLSGDTALVGAYLRDGAAGINVGSAYVFVRNGTTWTQQAELAASDGTLGDVFGYSVALSNDTAVIGAPGVDTILGADVGKVYVFTRSGSLWSLQTTLTASSAAAGDKFGWAVSMDVDTALVGAPFHDSGGVADSGSAYVFLRSGTSWSSQATLTASDGAANDYFGYAVALSGDTALVAAPVDDTTAGTDAGSVYVFFRSGTTWSPQGPKFVPADGAPGDYFGFSVSLSGNTAIVGAPNADTAAGIDAGGAYFYVRSGTTWSQQGATMTATGSAADASFGASVSVSGDTAIAGVPSDDTAAGTDAGSAYVFQRNGTTWSQQAKLTESDSASLDYFGFSVSLDGDTALVGAPFDDFVAGTDSGSAYMFLRSNSSWSLQARLTVNDGAAYDRFGISVALSGETALIGALNHDTAGGVSAGAAYVFVRTGSNWSQQGPPLTANDGAANDSFGSSVALDGDNALIGANNDDTAGGTDAGSAYVFVRSGTSWSQQAKLTASDGAANDSFGYAVSLSGDTALVGAVSADTSAGADAGSAYVFVRSGTAWSPQAKLTGNPSKAGADFGYSVAVRNDTALIGARLDQSVAGVNGGAAYVFTRTGTTWLLQARLTASDAAASDEFGSAVALDGDTALVGAPAEQTIDGIDSGCAYAFVRSGTIWSQAAKLTAGVDSSSVDLFGAAVSLSGDTALVGAYLDDTAATDAGSAYTFLLGELPSITSQPVSRTVIPGVNVTFTVNASGYGPLRYQWRKDGFAISGANTNAYSVSSAQLADAGNYDVVVSNIGGVVTSAPATLAVNALSQFTQSFPGLPLEAQGFILVNLTPTGIGTGWRFVGEQQWRPSGVPVGGLVTGDRQVEFRPVPGYLQPLRETVSVMSGGEVTVLDLEYYETTGGVAGGLSVILKPGALAAGTVPQATRAQWRLAGEGDPNDPNDLTTSATWRDSGATASGLVPGIYLVECKPLSGRTTPPAISAAVQAGSVTVATATYFLADAPTGTQPGVIPFETVSTSQTLPYAFVGEIRSEAGVSSGFVVKSQVVATAGHVVFDDGTLSAAVGLQWLFQRDRGSYEPNPQIPRGSYVFSGYAAQRAAEATPGEASPASQELDAAALYFLEDAGRGGFGGFLASDAANNEWLLSSALKTLVGYPVDGIPAANQGRMHATTPDNVTFAAAFGHTYTTTAVSSVGGNSGGPLCVQFEGGNYYPAAIYLGGSAQTVVRAIDSGVIDLFTRAEVSGNGGSDNTGGGITQVNAPTSAGNFVASALLVELSPPAAVNAGARWKLSANGTEYAGHTQLNGLPPGNYTVRFKPVSGFLTPASISVTLVAGQVAPLNQSYGEFLPPTITTAALADAIRGENYSVQVSATQSPADFTAMGLAALGLQISASGQITGTPGPNSVGPHVVTITATNAAGTGTRDLTLEVREPGQLVLQFDPSAGNVTGKPKVALGSNVLGQGALETLTATAKAPNFIFAGWTLTDATSSAGAVTSGDPKLTFTMTKSVVAAATFIPSPYPAFADRYLGRIAPPSGVTVTNCGLMDVQVTKLGQMTGKLLLGVKSYPVKGQLLSDGTTQVTIKRPNLGDLVLQLTLDLNIGGTERITGTLTADGAGLPVLLDRAVFDAKNNLCPQAGGRDPKTNIPLTAQYTLALQRDANKAADQYPQGHGFGVVTVKPDGTVRFAGTLGDSTAMSQTSLISKTRTWPFHALLYAKGGVLTGDLLFGEKIDASDLDGALDWIKSSPTGPKTTYPGGFATQTRVIGSRYDRTMPVPNGTVTFGEGNLGIVLSPVLVTSAAGHLNADPAIPGFTLATTPTTGVFKGTVPTAAALKPGKFQGVIFQKTQRGYGWFLGAPLPAGHGLSTGYVEFVSPP